MKTRAWAESGRKIDVMKTTKFVSENLEILILRVLHGSESMSKHEIIREIFSRQGVSVSPNRLETMLGSLKDRGLVDEIKRNLLTAYTLTDEGRVAAKQVKIDELKKL